MKEIVDLLKQNQDKEYAAFILKLTPGLDEKTVIGIRMPVIRKIAKEVYSNMDYMKFLHEIPHTYYEENMLHTIVVSLIKDFDTVIEETDRFLPYVDNWAVCDTATPKVYAKHREELLPHIKKWIASDAAYTKRYGIEILMDCYLDEAFKPEYHELVYPIRSKEYYVNMMIAWYFATALAKQWDATILVIEKKLLDVWTHNKSIQKGIESYRITEEQKDYLRSLRIKK